MNPSRFNPMTAESIVQETQLEKLHVMIADDIAETRRTTRIMLSLDADVEVVAVASDGEEAVKLSRNHDLDIALVDINMPKMDGIQAIRTMVKEDPTLVCVVISTEQSSQMLYDAMAAGAREYLIKPFTVGELEKVIAKVRKLMATRHPPETGSELQTTESDHSLRDLKRQAREIVKARRSDDEAVRVLETLCNQPDSHVSWLKNLAIMYVLRNDWGKLRALAIRLENHNSGYGR